MGARLRRAVMRRPGRLAAGMGFGAVFLAVVLGAGVAGCSGPDGVPRGQAGPGAAERLAQAIRRGEMRVEPRELAQWLVSEPEQVLVIDLRPSDRYDKGHIDSARHADPAELLAPRGLESLPRRRRVVLVSERGGQAAEVAAVLRMAGVSARYLAGGYAAWRAYLAAGANAAPEHKAVSCYFEGGYLTRRGVVAPSAKGAPEPTAPARQEDTLGLGLDLGLGEGVVRPATPARPARPRRLRGDEGC